MNDLELFRFPQTGQRIAIDSLPGRVGHPDYVGHVYVIELSNGYIKVGRTANARKRITAHAQQAELFGVRVVKLWLSGPHMNPVETEALLIGYGREHGASVIGNEYFTGLDFDDVVPFARRLPFAPVDRNRIEDLEEQALTRIRTLIPAMATAAAQRTEADPLDALHQTIARLFGQHSDGTYRLPAVEITPLAELIPVAQDIADRKGCTVESVLHMSWLDMLEQIIATAVRVEALHLKAYAYEHGLLHLVEPMADRSRANARPALVALDGGAA